MIHLKNLEEFVKQNKDVIVLKGAVKPGDVVFAFVPPDRGYDGINELAEGLKSIFPHTAVAVIPNDIEIKIAEVVDNEPGQ